jgi:hypothetical protein
MKGLNTNPVLEITADYGYMYDWRLETSYSEALQKNVILNYSLSRRTDTFGVSV